MKAVRSRSISALLGRESLGTAAIEGELLDPGQVEGQLDVLLEGTSALEAPLPWPRSTTGTGAIGRERLHFEAPPRAQLDGLVRAGLAHLWFLTLHPYEDGNGRLAQAITDRVLAQDCRAQGQQGLTELDEGS